MSQSFRVALIINSSAPTPSPGRLSLNSAVTHFVCGSVYENMLVCVHGDGGGGTSNAFDLVAPKL